MLTLLWGWIMIRSRNMAARLIFKRAKRGSINAQTSSFKGWKGFDNNLNRYWLVENLNNKLYNNLRSLYMIITATGWI
jgi:hypothetical protein